MNRARVRELLGALVESPVAAYPQYVQDFIIEWQENPAAEVPEPVRDWLAERDALLEERGKLLDALAPQIPTRETIIAGQPLPAWHGSRDYEILAYEPWSLNLDRAIEVMRAYVRES